MWYDDSVLHLCATINALIALYSFCYLPDNSGGCRWKQLYIGLKEQCRKWNLSTLIQILSDEFKFQLDKKDKFEDTKWVIRRSVDNNMVKRKKDKTANNG
jgi:hypothetical protein